MSTEGYKFPVYGTQGGGIARFVGEKLIFVEAPKQSTGLTVGDEVPEQWDIQPANELARLADPRREFIGVGMYL
jgi:hypothetical protein